MAQFCEQCLATNEPELLPTPSRATDESPRVEAVRCASCGALAEGNANYCPSCGSQLTNVEYAGFWLRFAALLVDGVVLTVVNIIIDIAIDAFVTSLLIQMATAALYSIGFWVAADGQTPGKMLVGVRVTMVNGESLELGPAVLRYLGYFASTLLLGIGYLMVAFTPQKRGLHDYIAGTVVVRAR